MAITRREQQMLDLADQGLSPDAIAFEMEIKPASVRRTLGLLSFDLGSDRAREAAIAKGSMRLRDAIQQSGGMHQ